MQRLRLLSILLLTSLLISSCAPSEPGRYAHVTLGPDYPHGVGLRVLLLPVNVEGDPARHEDRAATEAMGQRLMEIGYRVIDWEQAKSRAAATGVNLHSANEADVMRVARDLGVDALGKGLLVMGFSAGRSESGVKFETVKRTEIRNGTHRKDTVIIKEEVPTPYSYSSESSYYVASQRLRLVSVQSGELLLSAAVDRGSYDMDEELAWGIRRAVSRK